MSASIQGNSIARLAAVAAMAKPQHSSVLTWPNDADWRGLSHGQVRTFMAPRIERLVESLRAQYRGGFECLVVPELEPKDGRPHAHLLARGNLKHKRLRVAASEVGLGWATTQDVEWPVVLTVYALKVPLLSLGLDVDQRNRLMEFQRELSGGRGVWATRGYWLDGEGQPTSLARALDACQPQLLRVEEIRSAKGWDRPEKCVPRYVWDYVLNGGDR